MSETTTRYLQTKCCACEHAFRIRPSISMQFGINSGHVTCPKCKEFLHVEQLEGNAAWTMRWNDFIAREFDGPTRHQGEANADEAT